MITHTKEDFGNFLLKPMSEFRESPLRQGSELGFHLSRLVGEPTVGRVNFTGLIQNPGCLKIFEDGLRVHKKRHLPKS